MLCDCSLVFCFSSWSWGEVSDCSCWTFLRSSLKLMGAFFIDYCCCYSSNFSLPEMLWRLVYLELRSSLGTTMLMSSTSIWLPFSMSSVCCSSWIVDGVCASSRRRSSFSVGESWPSSCSY